MSNLRSLHVCFGTRCSTTLTVWEHFCLEGTSNYNFFIFSFLYNVIKNCFHLIKAGWFAQNLVNIMTPSFLNKFISRVTCHCNYKGLRLLMLSQVIANLVACFIAIHYRHLAVHEDKTIRDIPFNMSFFHQF